MKAVLLSVRPQWCEMIANGKKTIEVRKTIPKTPTPFKCYIYCTQGEEKWLAGIIGERQSQKLNGKVIGEFVCDKMYGIYYSMYPHDPLVFEEIGTLNRPDLQEKTCLSEIEIDDYLSGNNGYGWHISDLKIYDNPKELSEFTNLHKAGDWERSKKIERPPMSWCYVEEEQS